MDLETKTDKTPRVHVIGGGTSFHVRPHFAVCAPAYGGTARRLAGMCREEWGSSAEVELHLTKMADSGRGSLDTNEDVHRLLKELIGLPATKALFMPVALCDFEGSVMEGAMETGAGPQLPRLRTRDGSRLMALNPARKLIGEIRRYRKDLFLVGFKTTTGASEDEQFLSGLELLKRASCNLVLANDLHTRLNMVVTPEQARYHVTKDRQEALRGLVQMARSRSQLRFTKSQVEKGSPVDWGSDAVPASLREVVNHCVRRGAYKPFLGSTVGHFAARAADGSFLTSIRKSNFNEGIRLVRVVANGDDAVVAYGAKPSVGGQSQRIIFREHPEADCIVHFHCRMRPGSRVPIRSQREYECGSHECGQNTSTGLKRFGKVLAVMLDRHGPNVVFPRDTDPAEVIAFIEENFDLDESTDGVAARHERESWPREIAARTE